MTLTPEQQAQSLQREAQMIASGQALLAKLNQPAQPVQPQEQPQLHTTSTEEQAAPEWETPAHKEVDPFDPDYSEIMKHVEVLPLAPAELKAKPNWVRWKLETVNGHLTKVPYQLNHSKASSTNPKTWNTYEAVITGAVIDETQGVGIMTDGSFIGFDLDGCRNPQTGEITSWAKFILDTLDAYTEITPSGFGIRAYVEGKLPDGPRRFSIATSAGFGDKVGIEVYNQNRYFTVTGKPIKPYNAPAIYTTPERVDAAYRACFEISRQHPSEKRKSAASDGSNHGSVQIEHSGTVVTTKLALLMYGEIVSRSPFVITDEHGNKITYPSQSEADMALATVLAIKHGDNPELIDSDFRESSLYRPKWDRLADKTIQKAIQLAQTLNVKKPIEIPSAQTQADAAAQVSNQVDGMFPEGEIIPEFEDDLITGELRGLVDAVCVGTTIPRQYGLLAAKSILCSIITKYKIVLEDCESSRSYFILFGESGTGKGLSFRRMQTIVDATQNIQDEYVKIIHSIDSGAGLRDAFFEIPMDKNRPIFYFADEIKTLGHKADGKKNPEIIDAIIEMANTTIVSRTKASTGVKSRASKTRTDSFLFLFACAQDGEAYATAFPRTKLQGLPDRFIPEYSPKVEPGELPVVNTTLGAQALAKLLDYAQRIKQIKMAGDVRPRIGEIWSAQEAEFRQSPRLRQQFLLEMYLSAFSRGSAVAESQDLDVAVKALNRQKPIRRKFFADEIPNQVGVFGNRLKKVHADMTHRLRQGTDFALVAMSLRDIMTKTLAYKENDLPNFNQAWKAAQSTFFVEVQVTSPVNGHAYKKWVPLPEESDTWLPAEMTKGKVLG
jgi:hypothetical protein